MKEDIRQFLEFVDFYLLEERKEDLCYNREKERKVEHETNYRGDAPL